MFQKIRSYLLFNANQNNVNSVSDQFRRKRFDFFRKFCSELKKPISILDLGGSDYHWRNSEFAGNRDFDITIINLEDQNTDAIENIKFIKKDVRNLESFTEEEFDVVYSNSLIEHINDKDSQQRLAEDIRRIGRHYFIQTPNYYFPVEPHFLFPFFQFLPFKIKSALIRKYDLGWYSRQPEKDKADELAGSVRLLKLNELKKLFTDGNIYHEKYLFLNKSFIIYK